MEREVSRSRQNLAYALRLLRREWWIVVMCGLVGLLCGLAVNSLQSPVYSASATLYVTPGYGGGTGSSNVYQDELAAQQRAISYSRLVTSDVIARAALESSGIDISVGDYRSSVSASVTPDTTLLTITARSGRADVARDLANAAASATADYVSSLEHTATNSDITRLSVVTPAAVNANPVSPLLARSLLFGLTLGIIVSVAALFIRARYDELLRSPSDVSEVVGLPILASIPSVSDSESDRPVLNFSDGGQSVEAYRRLFVNLRFSAVDRPAIAVLVTSPKPGDGKSTVALNLAAAIVDSGRSVCVVDCDLRRPVVSSRLGVSGTVGLTSVLSGDGSIADFIQVDPSTRIPAMTSGALPPSPAQVLGSDRMKALLNEMKTMYEFVVIDSPPILSVADSTLLVGLVDCSLVVVCEGSTRRSELASAVAEVDGASSSLVGIVLNRTSTSDLPYSYSHYSQHAEG